MAISHLAAGQAINMLPLGRALANTRVVALFKTEQREVRRLVLLTGKSLPCRAMWCTVSSPSTMHQRC